VVEFEAAVRGAKRYEVCRLFLATLQLANNGNVSIIPSLPSSSSAVSDAVSAHASLSLRLLSTHQRNPVEIMQWMQLGRPQQGKQRKEIEMKREDKAGEREERGSSDNDGGDGEEGRERRRKRAKPGKWEKAMPLQAVDVNVQVTDHSEDITVGSQKRQTRQTRQTRLRGREADN